jgi:hypothetical protein
LAAVRSLVNFSRMNGSLGIGLKGLRGEAADSGRASRAVLRGARGRQAIGRPAALERAPICCPKSSSG